MIFILAFFLLLIVTLSALEGIPRLAVTNAACMVCAIALGRGSFVIDGYIWYIGAIFFSAAVYGVAIGHTINGRTVAQLAVGNILCAFVIVFGSLGFLDYANMLPAGLSPIPVRRIEASFVSIWGGLTFLIWMLDHSGKIPLLVKLPIAMIFMQALTSLIYAPVAYGGTWSYNTILHYIVIGWIVKSTMALLTIPFIVIVLYVKKQSYSIFR